MFNRLKSIYDKAIINQDRLRQEYLHKSKGEKETFNLGDWVLYWKPESTESKKFQNFWDGPFRILTKYDDTIYGFIDAKGYEIKANVNRLHHYSPFAGNKGEENIIPPIVRFILQLYSVEDT